MGLSPDGKTKVGTVPIFSSLGISNAAASVIGQALAFDPADRWPTAGAFADALAQT
jgi:hypothetical protein